MQDLFKNKIIDDLYEIRGEEFEERYINKYGETEEMKKSEEQDKKLIEMLKLKIKNQKDIKEVMEQLKNTELAIMTKYCFWYEKLYKLGFIDGINLKKEIQEERTVDNDCDKAIIYQRIDEITDYIEEQSYNSLKLRDDYKEIVKEMKDIKGKYPKIRAFMEEEEITEFTKEEIKALFDVLSLQNDMFFLEKNEMFKIGLREGKAL